MMNPNYSPKTLAMAMAWLNQVPRGIALCNTDGSLLHTNELFSSFDIPSPSDLIQQSIGLDIESFDHQIHNKSIRIDIVKLDDGYAIIAEDIQKRLITSDKIIANLVASDVTNLFETAVKSISELSGWRWVAISRFKDDHTAEILSIYDQQEKVDNYLYDLMGTPCEVVARTQQFAFFPKLMDRFPYYRTLHEMGATVYAGMVYRANNVAIGHVFAMNDHPDVNALHVEDIIRLSTSIIGHKLEVERAEGIARGALEDASRDALTGALNRRAFDKDMDTCIEYARDKTFSDTLLGIVDLDGMKHVNDTQGHDIGDKLLKVFSKSLIRCSRPEDKVYRLGGDEFAMILNGAGLAQIDAIIQRVKNAVKSTQQAGFTSIDASVGFSSLSERSDDLKAWFKLADERMYKHKKSKKNINRY